MRRTNLLLATLVTLAAVGSSCNKDPLDHLSQEESRIYITNFDSTVNFAAQPYKTFTISDSIAVINNDQAAKESTPADQAYIAAVVKYLQQYGYTRVDRSNSPDLAVNVSRVYNTSTGVISYDNYWNYYGGYWDPYYYGYGGFGYGVPYYGYSIYQITEGAMSVDLLDLKNAREKNKINIIWSGLIRGSGIFNESVADTQVKALFDQSAYLKTN